VAITAFPALPPLFEQTPTATDELTLAREVLEHATLFAVSQQDDAAAERNFNQLRPYYSDCAGMIPPSPRQALLTGLNLLRLLVQNRIAEFHTELELIPPEAHTDTHVAFCLDLESSLMEGAYNKILAASTAIPTPDYAHFMTMLNATVRDEIAACMERAYKHLNTNDAARLLSVKPGKELDEFANERGWVKRGDGNAFVFREETAPPNAKDIPSMQLINQTLLYAKELERIV